MKQDVGWKVIKEYSSDAVPSLVAHNQVIDITMVHKLAWTLHVNADTFSEMFLMCTVPLK